MAHCGASMRDLDVDCLAVTFSFLSPVQICRLAHVSRAWAEAAASDVAWGRLLPPLCAAPCFQKALEARRQGICSGCRLTSAVPRDDDSAAGSSCSSNLSGFSRSSSEDDVSSRNSSDVSKSISCGVCKCHVSGFTQRWVCQQLCEGVYVDDGRFHVRMDPYTATVTTCVSVAKVLEVVGMGDDGNDAEWLLETGRTEPTSNEDAYSERQGSSHRPRRSRANRNRARRGQAVYSADESGAVRSENVGEAGIPGAIFPASVPHLISARRFLIRGDIALPFPLRPGAYEAEWRIARDPAEGEREKAEERLTREAEWADCAEAEAWRDLGVGAVNPDELHGKLRGKGRNRRKGRRAGGSAELEGALSVSRLMARGRGDARRRGRTVMLHSGVSPVKDELEEEVDDVAAKLAFWRRAEQRSDFNCWEEWPLTSGAQVVLGELAEREAAIGGAGEAEEDEEARRERELAWEEHYGNPVEKRSYVMWKDTVSTLPDWTHLEAGVMLIKGDFASDNAVEARLRVRLSETESGRNMKGIFVDCFVIRETMIPAECFW